MIHKLREAEVKQAKCRTIAEVSRVIDVTDHIYHRWRREPGALNMDQRHRFNTAMQNRIRQEYAYQVIARQQRARGRSVSRERLPSGPIERQHEKPEARLRERSAASEQEEAR